MDGEREIPARRPRGLPAALAPHLRGRSWFRDRVGESGCAVWRLARPGAPDLYLKRGRGPHARDAGDEADRLEWARGRLPVPALLARVSVADAAWMLTTALPGPTTYQGMQVADAAGRVALARSAARILARVHALRAADCPFDASAPVRLTAARARLEAGLIGEDEFDAERAGWTGRQLWDAMQDLLPLPADEPVVTHGDYSLDNLLIDGGEVTGLIDLGRLGRADRYQDLAILWNCLREFGDEVADAALAEYGAHPPDERRMRFHLMLDECF